MQQCNPRATSRRLYTPGVQGIIGVVLVGGIERIARIVTIRWVDRITWIVTVHRIEGIFRRTSVCRIKWIVRPTMTFGAQAFEISSEQAFLRRLQ